MNQAYDDAEVLIMEIDMDDIDPVQTQRITMQLGTLPATQSIAGMLDAASYAQLQKEARRLGLDPNVLNRFQPWLAALTLVQMNLMKMGLDPNAGVERRLTAQAARDGKEIHGLESIEQQFGMLASLPAADQRDFLLYSIEDSERATREIHSMLAAWRTGDTDTLAALLAEGYKHYPRIYGPLTVERNRRWLARLEGLLEQQEDYLVVVGALHLVGDDSVVELLQRKGHKVRQH